MISYLSISALLALVPMLVYAFRSTNNPGFFFWCFLGVAIAGSGALTVVMFSEGWRTGFSSALWITITATLFIYIPIVICFREGYKLAAGLTPYLLILGIMGIIWQNQTEQLVLVNASDAWMLLHIIFSITTYALLTLAAIAGISAFIQERSLKTKHSTRLNVAFPSLASSETLESRLLQFTAAVLLVGLITGMTVNFLQAGSLFELSHKTLLSVGTLAIVLILLIARKVSGLRGQSAARWLLLAYLTLTLAYPGVKFVTDILMI